MTAGLGDGEEGGFIVERGKNVWAYFVPVVLGVLIICRHSNGSSSTVLSVEVDNLRCRILLVILPLLLVLSPALATEFLLLLILLLSEARAEIGSFPIEDKYDQHRA